MWTATLFKFVAITCIATPSLGTWVLFDDYDDSETTTVSHSGIKTNYASKASLSPRTSESIPIIVQGVQDVDQTSKAASPATTPTIPPKSGKTGDVIINPEDYYLETGDETWLRSMQKTVKTRPKKSVTDSPSTIIFSSPTQKTTNKSLNRQQTTSENLGGTSTEFSEWNSFFYQTTARPLEQLSEHYNDHSLKSINALKEEVDYNKFLVASLTFAKASLLLDWLQNNLTNLLSPECHLAEFPNIYQRSGSENKMSSKSPELPETCQTSRAFVTDKIQELEELVSSNKRYREQAASVQQNLVYELASLYNQGYQQSLDTVPIKSEIRDSEPQEPFERLVMQRYPEPEVTITGVDDSSPRHHVKRYSGHSSLRGPNPSGQMNINEHISEMFSQVSQGSLEGTMAPLISEQFEQLEKQNRRNQLSDREKVDAFFNLIQQVKSAGLNGNPDIFLLASLIKNCRHHAHIVPYVKHFFPGLVQKVVWGMKNKLEIVKEERRVKLFADAENNVQTMEVVGGVILNGPVDGEVWKFIPMNGGTSFVLYNIQRNAVLMTVPAARNETLGDWREEAKVTMESVSGRDVTMLLKRLEYLWVLTLSCELPPEGVAEGVVMTENETDPNCKVTIESNLYKNLALNLNPFGYVKLLSNGAPGLFEVISIY